MKNSKKIAFCSIMAALSVILVMCGNIFQAASQAMPAIAGVIGVIIVIEIGVKWAFAAYFVSAALTFILGINEAGMLFALFFGYYPIIKSIIEKIRVRVIEYIVKFALFNAAMIASYAILIAVFSLVALGFDTMLFAWITLAIGNIFFILYDICISRIAALYCVKYRKYIKKLLK
ncbi:MAG: hypothetical protein IIW73_07775 [Clostridia bacterium]|nr:hypothetical protein [Clostridia bacterium]